MSEIPPDVLARLSSEYAGETYFEALRLVESLGLGQRVFRAIIFLAAGDFEELLRFARVAERDWRDVIFWAEYEDHDSENPRWVRSMSEPFADS